VTWRVLLHDYSGHPFQVQLSRSLARAGHEVLHVHCPSFLTPKGHLEREPDDPAGFRTGEIRLPSDFAKYSWWKRPLQEVRYAWRYASLIRRERPDVVISSNTPLVAEFLTQLFARRTPFVLWQQDVYSFGMSVFARNRLGRAGEVLARLFRAIDARTARHAAGVVTISEDFVPILASWGVPRDRVTVVENWAPLDEIDVRPRDNAWAVAHGLVGRRVLLYAGTLGLKHDPSLLTDLALHVADRPDVVVVVASEGDAARSVAAAAEQLPNLTVVGFQPFEDLPDMLGAATGLIVLLEPAAGVFAVPSKVLTYLCAGRPILGVIPADNLAARTIARADAGRTAPPRDRAGFLAAADAILDDPALGERLGANGRAYAEVTFDIDRITKDFAAAIERALAGRGG
jgi:colanic acid biosynthesis glycosyl transferase WcaI